MKQTFLFILLFSILNSLLAQKTLLFLNKNNNKAIEVEVGNTLSIQYVGYNNQIYFTKNVVTEINDTSIVLGHYGGELPLWIQKLSKNYESGFKIVQIKDIVSFRKISNTRLLGKSLLSTTITVSAFVGTYNLFRNGNLSPLSSILISLGIGFGTTLFNSYVLPDNPLNKINNDWLITVRN